MLSVHFLRITGNNFPNSLGLPSKHFFFPSSVRGNSLSFSLKKPGPSGHLSRQLPWQLRSCDGNGDVSPSFSILPALLQNVLCHRTNLSNGSHVSPWRRTFFCAMTIQCNVDYTSPEYMLTWQLRAAKGRMKADLNWYLVALLYLLLIRVAQ